MDKFIDWHLRILLPDYAKKGRRWQLNRGVMV